MHLLSYENENANMSDIDPVKAALAELNEQVVLKARGVDAV